MTGQVFFLSHPSDAEAYVGHYSRRIGLNVLNAFMSILRKEGFQEYSPGTKAALIAGERTSSARAQWGHSAARLGAGLLAAVTMGFTEGAKAGANGTAAVGATDWGQLIIWGAIGGAVVGGIGFLCMWARSSGRIWPDD